MEFIDVIMTRRSIRKFSAADVSDEMVLSLIGCAVKAPSSMNGQPWRFIVVRSHETKKRLAETKDKYCPPEKRLYPAGFIMKAPVLIITCVESAAAYDRGIESGVIATGNLLLAAANYGLTGVYMSAYKTGVPEVAGEIRAILRLPADIDPITIVPIGYPDEAAAPKTVRPLKEVTYYETFGRK